MKRTAKAVPCDLSAENVNGQFAWRAGKRDFDIVLGPVRAGQIVETGIETAARAAGDAARSRVRRWSRRRVFPAGWSAWPEMRCFKHPLSPPMGRIAGRRRGQAAVGARAAARLA